MPGSHGFTRRTWVRSGGAGHRHRGERKVITGGKNKEKRCSQREDSVAKCSVKSECSCNWADRAETLSGLSVFDVACNVVM